MKLSQIAIQAMPTGGKVRRRLFYELEVDRTTVDRWIEENEDESKLTTIKALQIIEEETGLTQDQILESENHTA